MIATTVAVVGFGSSFFSHPVNAETINDLQNKQYEIANERDTIKANLSKAEAEIADVLLELKDINEELARVEDALKENEKMMIQTKEEKAQLEEDIAELEAEIEERYHILSHRMTSYQKSGGDISYLEVLFGSKSFGEFISRITAVTKIANSDAELMQQIEEAKQAVEEKLAEVKEKEVELKGMEVVIKDQKEQTEASKKEVKEKENELKTLKADLQSQDSELASLEAQIRQDIEAARNPVVASTNTSANNTKAVNGNTNSAPKAQPVSGDGSISTVINAGYPHIGTPYTWGGKTPSGFDCSGFVSWAYGEAGYSIPSTTSGLANTGTKGKIAP